MQKRADLVRFFTLRLRSSEAAEDLVQDIYIKLKDIDARPINDPSAYLYRVGWNMMLDRLRKQRRETAREAEWSNINANRIAADAVTDEPSAENAVAARERLEHIVNALERLPAQTQRVFRLHKFEGLSQGEVAAKLGVSKSAVEKHVSAALRHLVGLNL